MVRASRVLNRQLMVAWATFRSVTSAWTSLLRGQMPGWTGRVYRYAGSGCSGKLDNFDFLLLDDLGYLPQGAEESEVLFTLIAERYERRSLGITSTYRTGMYRR